MRREGFELSLSKPRVITRGGGRQAVGAAGAGGGGYPRGVYRIVTERLSARRGRMVKMINHGYGRVRLEFEIPPGGSSGLRASSSTTPGAPAS